MDKELLRKNLLEELYFGELDLNVRTIHLNTDIGRLEHGFTERGEELAERLSGTEKSMALDMLNDYSEITANIEYQQFIRGFRIGAKLMLDTFLYE